jgi:hypothetical protein
VISFALFAWNMIATVVKRRPAIEPAAAAQAAQTALAAAPATAE